MIPLHQFSGKILTNQYTCPEVRNSRFSRNFLFPRCGETRAIRLDSTFPRCNFALIPDYDR